MLGAEAYLRFLISLLITETCWVSESMRSPQLAHRGLISPMEKRLGTTVELLDHRFFRAAEQLSGCYAEICDLRFCVCTGRCSAYLSFRGGNWWPLVNFRQILFVFSHPLGVSCVFLRKHDGVRLPVWPRNSVVAEFCVARAQQTSVHVVQTTYGNACYDFLSWCCHVTPHTTATPLEL